MCLARLCKRQLSTHLRPELSLIEEPCNLRETLARYFDQKESGFNARAARELLIRRRHRRDQLAASPERLKRAGLRLPAYQIDHRVSIPNGFLETLLPEIDHCVRAQLVHEACVIRGSRCENPQTRVMGKLDRKSSDVSGRPMNDDCLAALELSVIKQRLPRRDRDDRNRSCFNEGQ